MKYLINFLVYFVGDQAPKFHDARENPMQFQSGYSVGPEF